VVPGTSSVLVNTAEPRAPPSRVCNLQPLPESVCRLSVCVSVSLWTSVSPCVYIWTSVSPCVYIWTSVSPCVYIWTGAEIPIHGPPNRIQNAIQNSRFKSKTGSTKWIRISGLLWSLDVCLSGVSRCASSGVSQGVSPCLKVYLPVASLPACCADATWSAFRVF